MRVYNQGTPKRKDERFTIVKLDNFVTETSDGGAYTESAVNEIGDKTITQKIYKDQVSISDFAEEFDNYGAIKQAAMEKGADYKYKMDSMAVAHQRAFAANNTRKFILTATTTIYLNIKCIFTIGTGTAMRVNDCQIEAVRVG